MPTSRSSSEARPTTAQPAAGPISSTERAISAFVGYTAGAFVVAPFDRIKSLMQVSEASRRQGGLTLARSVYATQGISGLYKGFSAHMLIAPYTILYYSVYDELLVAGRSATAETSGPDGHPLVALGAALVARTLETSIRMPNEVLRTMMQTSGANSTFGGAVRTLLSQPKTTWFRGMVPTLLRDVPFSGIYWCAYEYAKTRVQLPESLVHNSSLRTLLQSFAAGGAAGIFAAVLTTPVDVIKTVMQHSLNTGQPQPSCARARAAHRSRTRCARGAPCATQSAGRRPETQRSHSARRWEHPANDPRQPDSGVRGHRTEDAAHPAGAGGDDGGVGGDQDLV